MKSDGDDILVEYSLFDIRRIAKGLMAPRDSGEHKLAAMAVTRLFGPASVSLLLSALVLAALLVLVKSKIIEKENRYSVTQYIHREDMKPAERQDVETALRDLVDRNDVPSAPAAFTPEPPAVTIGFQGPPPVADPPAVIQGNPDPVRLKGPILPGLFVNRTNPEMRKKALDDFDAPVGTDDRVVAALRWLKKKQDADGSWKTASDVDHVAMTGLAALTFLAHGETPQQSKEFGPTLERAIRFLMAAQKEDGRFSASSYTHAIVTYALAEAFALTRIMEIREPMEKGVAFLIRGQQEEGGFDYSYAKGARFDTSVAGWNIQALKAARIAGCTHPDLNAALERSVRFLKTQAYAQNGSGFVYSGTPGLPTPAGGRWSMTGVGTLGLQILGHARDPETRQGLVCMDELACDWPADKDAKPNVYGWYYVTQAKFHRGDSVWKAWNQKFSRAFLERQVREPDGCGFWPQGDHGGAVYATTLATLTLEVYYRYLPTYKTAPEAVTASSPDDIEVKVM